MLQTGDCVIVKYGDEEIMGHVDQIKSDVVYVLLTRTVEGVRRRGFPLDAVKLCPAYPKRE